MYSVVGAIVKYGTLKLIFRNPGDKVNEVVMEKSILLYLPHQENAPTTNYRVRIRDLYSGRVIAHKFLPIQNSGWHKVSLDHWPGNSYRGLGFTSSNHGLEVRLRQRNGGKIDFEEFYRKNKTFGHKLLPTLLIYYKNDTQRSLEDLLYSDLNSQSNPHRINKKTGKGGLSPGVPAVPQRTKRSPSNTSCNFIEHKINVSAWKHVNPIDYYPKTTKKCYGSCPASTSSNCSTTVQDCCVPSKKGKFALLYVANGSVILYTLSDVIVVECACASSLVNPTTAVGKG